MKWNIIADSSCDYIIGAEQSADVRVAKVPFAINIGGKEYIDNADLDVAAMVDDMENSPEASRTSCPAPGDWYEHFEQADCTIAVTISANLSGSYNSAMSAQEMVLEKHPEKKIFVLNSRSAGSALTMYVEKARELIGRGLDFEAVVAKLEAYAKDRKTVFALASFHNLVKNGRMSRLAGFVAGKLGIWGIGIASPEGTIKVKSKVRGMKRVLQEFIDDMKENGFKGGEVVISHCQNLELAMQLKEKIAELWAGTKVQILTTGGLCSYYAERRGLIVSY